MEHLNKLAKKIQVTAEGKGEPLTDKEAQESAYNLTRLFDLLFDMAQRQVKLKRKLKDFPEGFPVDGDYTCLVCKQPINETTGWYDWFGQTCLLCHKAVKDGIIPTFIFKNDDSYFRMWELKSSFDIKHQTAKKYIREGLLKPRIVLTKEGKPYEYIFLKKENPGLIDRKSPARKSYDRNRAKVSKGLMKEEKVKFKKMHEDHLKEMKKIKDKYRKK